MTKYVSNTARFVAVLRGGTGTVLPIASTDLDRIIAEEQDAGAVIVGEYSAHHHAERAIRVAFRGRKRCEGRKAS
jgi:hypothetical protein